MKRKKAIKLIKKGKIQIENDLLPSTKEIKKFLKKAFPEDDYNFKKDEDDIKTYPFYQSEKGTNRFEVLKTKTKPIVKLSAITKNKEAKLSQLEKQFSKLAKDVAEVKERLANDVKIIEKEIDWSVPQLVISDKGNVVATNGNHSKDSFEGIVVFSDNLLRPVNYFSNNWNKLYFKRFKGELTIKNKHYENN